ncbi:hypothetical protein [Cesiribacter sp. SM1]|uniref:hypothetical protein n=1 Tax=Cesiribacter sp. SM1 TaxID=2861196 RepID=UPI001CD1FEFD|nr:hypothetical protein [Cesiribacter sp. SM1]
MQYNRDYQNNRYNSFDRDRGRNERSGNDSVYESRNDSRGYDSFYDSSYSDRTRHSARDWDNDGSLARETAYDHDAARQSRGLSNGGGYPDSDRNRDYQGGRNFSDYNREPSYNSSRDYSNRSQSFDRDEYRNEQDFSRSNGGDFDRGRMYGRFNQESRNRGFDDFRNQDTGYNAGRGRDSYSNNDFYNSDRGEYSRGYDYDRNRGFEWDRGYGHNQQYDRQRDYRNDDYGRDQNFGRTEPRSVKDKYSSSSLHYSGITSIGEGDERNRDRYEGSRYIGNQRNDRNFAGSGIGSSQRYRY